MKVVVNESNDLKNERKFGFDFVCETIDDVLLAMKCFPNLFEEYNEFNKTKHMMLYGECLSIDNKLVPLENVKTVILDFR